MALGLLAVAPALTNAHSWLFRPSSDTMFRDSSSPTGTTAHAGAVDATADVIVLGAGISGLACAATLRNAGLRVVVLEARQRIGGRIHTIPLGAGPGQPAYPVDLGGAWVHGIGSSRAPNELYSLACELQLNCHPTDYNDAAVYTAEGARLADGAVADIDSLYHSFEQHLHSMLHAPDPRLALMPIQAALEAFMSSRSLTAAQRANLAFAVSNHMEHYWAGEARFMGIAALDEEVLPGGDVVLGKGYCGIVERLAHGQDVRLGHEVVAVQYGGGGVPGVAVTARVCPSAASGAAGISGGGAEGLVHFTARAAVVTLPVGVLRSGMVSFNPPLALSDPPKAMAITRLGMALYNKVIMLFEPTDVFWDDTAFIYRIPAPHEGGRWSYFMNLHKVTGAPILVAFNLGEAAAQLEGVSDEEAVAGALQALAGLYGAARVRRPRQAAVTRWGSDPHSRMSYTYIPAGLTSAAFDDVARPVLGSLFFAGEATHRRHYGTAHGAYDSGRQAAQAILRELLPARRKQASWSPGRVPLRAARMAPRPSSRWAGEASAAAVHGGGFGAAALGKGIEMSLALAPTGGFQPELQRDGAGGEQRVQGAERGADGGAAWPSSGGGVMMVGVEPEGAMATAGRSKL